MAASFIPQPKDILMNHILPSVILQLEALPYNKRLSAEQKSLLSLAFNLRAVCWHCDIMLRAYLSPSTEVLTRQHGAQIVQTGLPNRAAIRSITFMRHSWIYCEAILLSPTKARRYLTRIIFDDHDTPPTSNVATNPPALASFFQLSEVAIITSFGIRGAGFRQFLVELKLPRKSSLVRMALHGVDLIGDIPVGEGQMSFAWVKTLVYRWMVTGDDIQLLPNFIEIFPSLERLILIYTAPADNPLAIPLTAVQKRSMAESYSTSTIVEVQPPVPEAGIPAWFAQHVRDGSIWDLTRVDWRMAGSPAGGQPEV